MRHLPPKEKNLSPSSCDPANGRPPLPMVLMFLPLILGGSGLAGRGPGPTQRREEDRIRGWSDATETERHLLLISMGKFPRSRRLAWSHPHLSCPPPPPIPDRQGPPAPPLLTSRERPSLRASLALIQGDPRDRAERRSRHALTGPTAISRSGQSANQFGPSG